MSIEYKSTNELEKNLHWQILIYKPVEISLHLEL